MVPSSLTRHFGAVSSPRALATGVCFAILLYTGRLASDLCSRDRSRLRQSCFGVILGKAWEVEGRLRGRDSGCQPQVLSGVSAAATSHASACPRGTRELSSMSPPGDPSACRRLRVTPGPRRAQDGVQALGGAVTCGLSPRGSQARDRDSRGLEPSTEELSGAEGSKTGREATRDGVAPESPSAWPSGNRGV